MYIFLCSLFLLFTKIVSIEVKSNTRILTITNNLTKKKACVDFFLFLISIKDTNRILIFLRSIFTSY